MPLLHIKLQHDLRPQTLILRSVMINKDVKGTQDVTEDGVQIGLQKMFSGFEMLSNKGDDNKLFLPCYSKALTPTPAPLIYPLHLKLNAEEIKSVFEVEVFKKDGITPVSFTPSVDGHFKTIDLYFEFETAQHFEHIFNPGGLGKHSHV